jgi:hypothetical protein
MNEDQLFFDFGNSSDTPIVHLIPSFKVIRCDRHIISSLILLDFVVLAAYLYGAYLFVRGETDYLFGLASHVSWLSSS